MTITAGKIDHEYRYPYGDTTSYEEVSWLLETCDDIEDWGCGRGFLRNYVPDDAYLGVDIGVDSVPQDNPFADVTIDLRSYRSSADGVFMRHVLEHNHDWEEILVNALSTARKRMLLIIFTPWSETGAHEVIALHGPPEYPFYDPPVPNIAFDKDLVVGKLFDGRVEVDELATGTQYGVEHVIRVDRC